MKQTLRNVLILTGGVLILLILFACTPDSANAQFIVTFDANGGTLRSPESVLVARGDTV